jgi:hypothetical protein
MDLAGWTNDRLVSERLNRLPREQWVYGRANASVVMASFLHVAPSGMRFNGSDLGAWYASSEIATAAAEVAHHLRREAVARKAAGMTRVYRTYSATLLGDYRDLRNLQGDHPDLYSRQSYDAGQKFGERIRKEGGAGVLFDSLRRRHGCNMVAYRPTHVVDVVQADHYEVSVEALGRTIRVKRLTV